MDQAAPAICFADSDDEDYVSFDEEELQKGIADLYDEDSASDYNDDDDEDEADLNEIEIVQEEQQQNNNKNKKDESKGLFSIFSKRKRSSSKEKESESMAPRSAMSFNRSSKRKSKASQLNKRINRLQQNQQQYQRKKDKKVIHRQKVNTNVISIDLGTLKDAADNISTGDAFQCKSCKSILSKHDELLKSYGDIKLDDEDESIWICKFCNHINIIEIDSEEVPKAETVDYILAPPPDKDDESKSSDQSESQIIFCIDVSGSMCVSQQIDSKHSQFKLKGNRLEQDKDALSEFIDGNAFHLNQQSEIQYVSRLQCVQTAVNEQIENLSKMNPNSKIGLVAFNDDVTVIGDGMSKHDIITGDKLQNIQKLKEIGSKIKLNHNVGAAQKKLCDALWKLEEKGQTALGPALVVSIGIASAIKGSQVILCTDGLANIGVGSLESSNNKDQIEHDEDEDEEDPVLKWYEALGDYAMSKGVVVNIISITDDGCKLENLGKIVEITNGNLKRINPLNLAEKFSGIIENESVATNCQAKMLLHPGLSFHNTIDAAQVNLDQNEAEKKKNKMAVIQEQKDDDNDINMNDKEEEEVDKVNEGRKIYKISLSTQDCGNVFEGSRIFFEYVINKEKRSEFQNLKELPFQVQIEYAKKDGSKMLRVISQTKEITLDKQKVRNNLDFNVLAKYGTHVTTELCAKGDYESSRAWTSANTTFLNKRANNKQQLLHLANYAQDNVALDHQMQRQMQCEMMDEIAMAPQSASKSVSNSFFKSKSKKKKMKNRKNARNDQFASKMYSMKKKSHK